MTMPKAEDRFERSRRRLSISKAIGETLSFSLRHFVAFFLLGLLVELPTYLHSFLPRERLPDLPQFPQLRDITLPRPSWETDFVIPLVGTMLLGFVSAVMVQALLRDRRGDDWTVFPALAEALRRLPTVLGVSMVLAVALALTSVAADSLAAMLPIAGLLFFALLSVLALIFCVAIPCAAVDNAGIYYCFERSAELTSGSRWRILAIYSVSASPILAVALIAGLTLQYGFSVESLDILPVWRWLAGALGNVYFIALTVTIHEALVVLKEGPVSGDEAKVFD